MKRVASLYLPDWSIDRLRRAGRIVARPDLGTAAVAALSPGGDGWRPGARWARIPNSSPVRGGGPPAKPVVEGLGARRTGSTLQAPPPLRGPPPRTEEEWEALVVTTQREGSKVVIAAASPAARAIGLAPGMAVTQA
ncbi:hypothetical protein QH494_24160, partial [Sphingomonas sp. AR_OL41]|nr:hypothetical protein [Sphingomonas sp. AR_OL41]